MSAQQDDHPTCQTVPQTQRQDSETDGPPSLTAAVRAWLTLALIVILVIGFVAFLLTERIPSEVSGLKAGVVPEQYLPWIVRAGSLCPDITAPLIAAQLEQESGFDPKAISSKGAKGIAQFIDATWATWGQDELGTGPASPFKPADAIMAQGRFMCALTKKAQASDLGDDPIALALAGYNAGWGAVTRYGGIPPYAETQGYVRTILALAQHWAVPVHIPGHGVGVQVAYDAARWIGAPYVWGGGSPRGPTTGLCDDHHGYRAGVCIASGTVGWDGSALVQYAWWSQTRLPRTAAAQYQATAHRSVALDHAVPGDLIFWSADGTAQGIDHVGLYAGNGRVVHAFEPADAVVITLLAQVQDGRTPYAVTRPG